MLYAAQKDEGRKAFTGSLLQNKVKHSYYGH